MQRTRKAMLPRTKYYVLRIWHGVSPELIGPFHSSKERSRKLARVLERSDDQGSIFALHVIRSGRVSVAATPNLDVEAEHPAEGRRTQ